MKNHLYIPGVLALLVAFMLVFSNNTFAQSMTEMMWGIDRQGDDFTKLELPRWDPNLCLNECAKQELCVAWAYVISTNTCWLKQSPGGVLEVQNDVVSGAKTLK
jgi:hypothetical protein